MKKKDLDCLEIGNEGIYLDIIVSPNSSGDRINGVDKWRDRLKVHVKEKTENGKANNSVVNLLSSTFHVSSKKIGIVHGKRTRRKRVFIDVDDKEIDEIIQKILEVK